MQLPADAPARLGAAQTPAEGSGEQGRGPPPLLGACEPRLLSGLKGPRLPSHSGDLGPLSARAPSGPRGWDPLAARTAGGLGAPACPHDPGTLVPSECCGARIPSGPGVPQIPSRWSGWDPLAALAPRGRRFPSQLGACRPAPTLTAQGPQAPLRTRRERGLGSPAPLTPRGGVPTMAARSPTPTGDRRPRPRGAGSGGDPPSSLLGGEARPAAAGGGAPPSPALPACPAEGAGGPCPRSRHAARPGSSRSSRGGRVPSLRCETAAACGARVTSRRPRLSRSLPPPFLLLLVRRCRRRPCPAPLPGRPCRLGQGNEPQSPGVSAERHRQQAALPPAGLE